MKALISLLIIIMLGNNNSKGQTNKSESLVDAIQRIEVPLVENCQIKINGQFPDGEWNRAVKFKMSEYFEILFLADNENLYVGLKYAGKVADYEQPLDCLTEVYISINNTEFYNLHSSARLAEGLNRFSSTLKQAKYSLEEVNGWEANFGAHVRENDTKCKGNEYKISLSKIKGRPLKMACGIMAVNFSFRESANFPEKFSFNNSDKWVELILLKTSDMTK